METKTYTDSNGDQVTEEINDRGEVVNRTVVGNGRTVGIVGGEVTNCTVIVNGR
ncbi:hypothetical protein [Saccharopolyspora griseoalba]|uniref:Uncharacterized protein n=1 Tax=Saccharopolyspora griseoalba TaxID=1431848 RepID=A0ABW2LPX0_9PSEU